MAQRNWKETDRVLYKFATVGDTVEGTYLGGTHTVTKYGETQKHSIRTAEGVSVFFGSVVLDDLLDSIPQGTTVFLEYTGMIESGTGQKVKDFRMWTA